MFFFKELDKAAPAIEVRGRMDKNFDINGKYFKQATLVDGKVTSTLYKR